MSTVAGDATWQEDIENPDDGDPTNGATFQEGYAGLADRTRFLLEQASLAAANVELAKVSASTLRYSGGCYALGAGPLNSALYVAAGQANADDARYALSPDGKTWYDYVEPNVIFKDVAAGGDGAVGSRTLVFVGQYRSGGSSFPGIFLYPDDADANGDPYIPQLGTITPAELGSGVGLAYNAIANNGTVLCVVGDGGRIRTAPLSDLAAWTPRAAANGYTGNFYGVHAIGSVLIAYGSNGVIQRSTDHGATWTEVYNVPARGTLRSGDGVIVGCGAANLILRTDNVGQTWSPVEVLPVAAFNGARTAIYRMGECYGCILRHATLAKSVVMLSLDRGLTWTYGFTGALGYAILANKAIFSGERLVVVGSNATETVGALLASPIVPQRAG